MGYIEQVKNAELHLIAGPFAYALQVPGVTGFQHVPEHQVQRHGANNFGGNGPVDVTESYQGESGSITLEGTEGEKILAAILACEDPQTFVTSNPKRKFPLFIVSNSYEDDGVTPIRGSYVHLARVENTPRPVGPDARSYNFQAKWAKDFFGHKVAVEVFEGNATPVTSLTLGDTALADDEGNYALAVLRQQQGTKTVRVLRKGTDYTETETAITLTTGLGQNEKALVIYVVA